MLGFHQQHLNTTYVLRWHDETFKDSRYLKGPTETQEGM